MQKKVKIKLNSTQNARVIICMEKRVNKFNSMQEAMVVTCMQREGQVVELGSTQH